MTYSTETVEHCIRIGSMVGLRDSVLTDARFVGVFEGGEEGFILKHDTRSKAFVLEIQTAVGIRQVLMPERYLVNVSVR